MLLCMGELLFDELYAPDLPAVRYPGGAVANVAVGLCRLGVHAAYAGCVGYDPDGESLLALLFREHVDLSLVQRTRQFPSRIVRVRGFSDGGREFLDFGRRSPGMFADAQLGMDARLLEAAKSVHAVVVGTLELAYIPHRVRRFSPPSMRRAKTVR